MEVIVNININFNIIVDLWGGWLLDCFLTRDQQQQKILRQSTCQRKKWLKLSVSLLEWVTLKLPLVKKSKDNIFEWKLWFCPAAKGNRDLTDLSFETHRRIDTQRNWISGRNKRCFSSNIFIMEVDVQLYVVRDVYHSQTMLQGLWRSKTK